VRFVAVPFNREAKGPRIAELMLHAGGVPEELTARAHLRPARQVNENPGSMTVAGLRYLMKMHDWTRELDPQRLRRAREVSLAAARRRGWFAEPFVGIDAGMAARIADRFAADNEAFAQQHWQQSWEDVFAAGRTRSWVSNEIDPGTAPADVVEDLAAFADSFVAACKSRK
jgi:hypothetical protein